MNPSEVLRIVDAIHRDKHIDKEIVFIGIEAAIATAARKQYGDEAVLVIRVDRQTGEISGTRDGVPIAPAEIGERIGAQSAKQVMIQKIREAERDSVYEDYRKQLDQIVAGLVQRVDGRRGGSPDGGAVMVSLPGVDAVIPRDHRIPGETFHNGDRIRGVLTEVKKNGNKVKVVISRVRPLFVQRLFEQEVPEIQEAVIEIKGVEREPGYRSKVAVYSPDARVDSVGSCIGMRGSRIKNITDELHNERIDVVPWSADMMEFIPNALRPAEIEEVVLCQMLGRAIVLVQPDQRLLAIGRKGQNVRLASKLVGWDIEIMTRDELDADIEKAIGSFRLIDGMTDDLADRLVGEGFLTFDDLSIIEPNDLVQMGEIALDLAESFIERAERLSEEEERIREKSGILQRTHDG
ncbi:MAG: transcription termination factor NusA [Planctomycetaceae bacterium]|jgi:N utilization substance protein A|nr:transcription termination factor NusA [Planctomycetaceae bacterium]